MVDGGDRMHASVARERESTTFHRVRAGRVAPSPPPSRPRGRGAPADQRVLDQLRQVGRELLDEPVPQSMLDILRAGEDPEA